MQVLVTGGSGFIGRHLVPRLTAAGHRVTVVDRNLFPASGPACIIGDLREAEVVDRAIQPGIEGVIHLAATTRVLDSMNDPEGVFENNVAVTQRLLERCREVGVARFVLASTNAVVGNVGAAVIDEEIAVRPLTPYGATKAAAEMLLSAYSASYGLHTTALRFTNVYGAGMQVKDSVIARLMRAALAKEGIEVYGDGEQLRDYLYVTDAAAALQRGLDLDGSNVLTIGAGESVSLNTLHAMCCEVSGVPIAKSYVAGKTGEMPAVVVSNERAQALGLAPSYSLREGLEETWRSFKESSN